MGKPGPRGSEQSDREETSTTFTDFHGTYESVRRDILPLNVCGWLAGGLQRLTTHDEKNTAENVQLEPNKIFCNILLKKKSLKREKFLPWE